MTDYNSTDNSTSSASDSNNRANSSDYTATNNLESSSIYSGDSGSQSSDSSSNYEGARNTDYGAANNLENSANSGDRGNSSSDGVNRPASNYSAANNLESSGSVAESKASIDGQYGYTGNANGAVYSANTQKLDHYDMSPEDMKTTSSESTVSDGDLQQSDGHNSNQPSSEGHVVQATNQPDEIQGTTNPESPSYSGNNSTHDYRQDADRFDDQGNPVHEEFPDEVIQANTKQDTIYGAANNLENSASSGDRGNSSSDGVNRPASNYSAANNLESSGSVAESKASIDGQYGYTRNANGADYSGYAGQQSGGEESPDYSNYKPGDGGYTGKEGYTGDASPKSASNGHSERPPASEEHDKGAQNYSSDRQSGGEDASGSSLVHDGNSVKSELSANEGNNKPIQHLDTNNRVETKVVGYVKELEVQTPRESEPLPIEDVKSNLVSGGAEFKMSLSVEGDPIQNEVTANMAARAGFDTGRIDAHFDSEKLQGFVSFTPSKGEVAGELKSGLKDDQPYTSYEFKGFVGSELAASVRYETEILGTKFSAQLTASGRFGIGESFDSEKGHDLDLGFSGGVGIEVKTDFTEVVDKVADQASHAIRSVLF